jgi:hypothetical protein
MKKKRHSDGPVAIVTRLLSALILLMAAFGANAADYMQCLQVYQKSLGTPGTPTCAIQVAGTSPMSRGAQRQWQRLVVFSSRLATLNSACGSRTGSWVTIRFHHPLALPASSLMLRPSSQGSASNAMWRGKPS